MKTVNNVIDRAAKDTNSKADRTMAITGKRPSECIECNYTNNYYGDQVCVARQ